MYTPAAYRETDRERLHAMMRENSFALLVSTDSDGIPTATHLPFYLDENAGEYGTLYAHLARPNPQWRSWETADSLPEVLVVFSGPHAYISPRGYANPDAPNVPTWNYVAVHAYGVPRLQTPHELRETMPLLVGQYEPSDGWSMDTLPENYTQKMLQGIVGVAITITRLEGKWKMSQNKSDADRRSAIQFLQETTRLHKDSVLSTAAVMESAINP